MSESESEKYSRAFDNMMTDGPDDIVGLLAYALFKQNIREEASQGVRNEPSLRNPTPVMVELFRTSAQSRLNDFGASMIDDARVEIQESATLERLRTAEAAIVKHVSDSTGTGRAILTNLAAWAVTAGLTILIIVGLAIANVQERITNAFTDRISNAVRADNAPEAPPPSN